MNEVESALPSAVRHAVSEEYALRLVDAIKQIEEPLAQVVIFCPERECVVAALVASGRVESWLIAPAHDCEDAAQMGDALLPMFRGVAEQLGHYAAASVIAKARH